MKTTFFGSFEEKLTWSSINELRLVAYGYKKGTPEGIKRELEDMI